MNLCDSLNQALQRESLLYSRVVFQACRTLSFSGIVFSGIVFSGIVFSGIVFSGIVFSDVFA